MQYKTLGSLPCSIRSNSSLVKQTMKCQTMKCVVLSYNSLLLLLVFFFLLRSSSALDDIHHNNNNNNDLLHDIEGKPLKAKSLYYAFHKDGNWVFHISKSHGFDHKGDFHYPVQVVESGQPVMTFGAPVQFDSSDPSATIGITTQTPLVINTSSSCTWFADTSTNPRFIMADQFDEENPRPLSNSIFFFKRSGYGKFDYHIALQDGQYVKTERDSSTGLKRLVVTRNQANPDLLLLQFHPSRCF